MTFKKLPPQDVAQVRTVRVSDRVMNHIIKNYGSLAKLARSVYETETQLKKLNK